MYTLVFLSASSFVSKSGVSMTVYRVFIKTLAGLACFRFFTITPLLL